MKAITINHETYCGQDLIALLLKAGFDWQDYFVAHSIDEHFHWEIPLHIVQRWLREVKSFMVETTFITDEFSILYYANLYEVVSEKSKGRVSELISVVRGQSELKRTYEEAQENGIKKALEMILEK